MIDRFKSKMSRFLILTIAALLCVQVQSACDNADRFCDGGTFTQQQSGAYMGVDTWLDWELFEGSIPLTQGGMFWKEISDDSRVQYASTNSDDTREVMRIRQAWAQANPDNNYVDLVGTENQQRQFIFEDDVTPALNYGWFTGDVVPFQTCAYVVKMRSSTSSSASKTYTFERYQLYITWNATTEEKQLTIENDHTNTYTYTNRASKPDFPRYLAEFNYNPYWGAFYYVSKGKMYILGDDQADTEDACVDKSCDQNLVTNYCARTSKLFDTATTDITFAEAAVGTSSWENKVVAQAMVFDSIFIVMSDEPTIIVRVAAVDVAAGVYVTDPFYTMSGTDFSNIGATAITSMCSMDYYGLFVGVESGFYLAAIKPDLTVAKETDVADPNFNKFVQTYDGNGILEINTNTFIERNVRTDSGDTAINSFRLLQTRGYMARHRPCYIVSDNSVQRLLRLTTVINPFMDIADNAAMAGKSDLYNPEYPEPQMLRFKLMTVEPRDQTGAIDYDTISAGIVDLRAQDAVSSYDMGQCGDTTQNTTFELCEYAINPPIDGYIYDSNGAGTFYPEHDNNLLPANSTVVYQTGYLHDIYSDPSICTDREDPDCVGYFTCNELCRLVQYDGCGDGVPTNGPPPTDAFTLSLDENQRSGTMGWEACDDNNNDDDDGCKGDCSAIEDGYECLEWGHPCTPLCGNGHIEVYEVETTDLDGTVHPVGEPMAVAWVNPSTGLTEYRVEQCDFGTDNKAYVTGDEYIWPCDENCQLIDDTKWDCSTLYSVEDQTFRNYPAPAYRTLYHYECEFLCGNQVVDVADPFLETCDLGEWPFQYFKVDEKWLESDKSTQVLEATITGYDYEPKTNTNLVLGCDKDCKHISTGEFEFKCPLTWDIVDGSGATIPYQCTDRCGDGLMDGPITDGVTTLRAGDMPTGLTDVIAITKIPAYIEDEDYASRILSEECDNGGVVDADGRYHGCDEFCRIITGWTCTNYYHHLITVEYPLFTSLCHETADPCQGSSCTRRRLSPMDFDKDGRRLDHVPLTANKYILPANTWEYHNDKQRLHFSPSFGTNGQLRIMETRDYAANPDMFMFLYAYQLEDPNTDDQFSYLAYDTSQEGQVTDQLSSTSASAEVGTTKMLQGKQRNCFGSFCFFNINKQQIVALGYAADNSAMFAATNVDPSIEYLGNHEYYWFPYMEFILARLSDGRNFYLLKFDKAEIEASDFTNMATHTMQTEYNLFPVPGRINVPPVFWGRMAYFYTSGTQVDKKAYIRAYQWSIIENGFVEKCVKAMTDETSQNLYHKYSFINAGDDGVIFKEQGGANFVRYVCDPDTLTWTTDAQAVTFDMNSLTCGAASVADNAALTLVQVRDDPMTYVEGTVRDIYALMTDDCIMKVTYATNTLTVDTVYDLTTRTNRLYTVTPEHFDVTFNRFGLMSPVQCENADYPDSTIVDTEYVLNPSIDFYDFVSDTWVCKEIDATDGGTHAWDLPRTVVV